jgi:hypothetical protein
MILGLSCWIRAQNYGIEVSDLDDAEVVCMCVCMHTCAYVYAQMNESF